MTLAERPLVSKTMPYSSSGAGMVPELSVKLTTTAGEVIETSLATEIPEGILQESLSAGDKTAKLHVLGEVYLTCSEAIAIGDFVVPSTAGKFKKWRGVDGNLGLQFVYARAKESTTTTGQRFLAEIVKFYAKDEERYIIQTIQSVTNTGDICQFSPRHDMTLQHAYILVVSAAGANDTDYETFTLVNKGQDGSGSTAMLKVDDLNTTKATGGIEAGAGLTAYKVAELTLHGTAANLAVSKNDVLVFGNTKASSGVALVNPVLILDFQLDLA